MSSTSAVVAHAVPLSTGGVGSGEEAATRRVRIYRHVISTTLQPQQYVAAKDVEDAEPAGNNRRSRGARTSHTHGRGNGRRERLQRRPAAGVAC